ncbi:hypothetical protein PLICRDRAFT_234532 [Plicaturopsis crispa FD-325 SS-3]|nr:hypothetical protein PLICRDRAFT_234532 [Plicaturopsis crispa FD-325 SS-3]
MPSPHPHPTHLPSNLKPKLKVCYGPLLLLYSHMLSLSIGRLQCTARSAPLFVSFFRRLRTVRWLRALSRSFAKLATVFGYYCTGTRFSFPFVLYMLVHSWYLLVVICEYTVVCWKYR